LKVAVDPAQQVIGRNMIIKAEVVEELGQSYLTHPIIAQSSANQCDD